MILQTSDGIKFRTATAAEHGLTKKCAGYYESADGRIDVWFSEDIGNGYGSSWKLYVNGECDDSYNTLREAKMAVAEMNGVDLRVS